MDKHQWLVLERAMRRETEHNRALRSRNNEYDFSCPCSPNRACNVYVDDVELTRSERASTFDVHTAKLEVHL